jgi:serine/threonine protein kinase
MSDKKEKNLKDLFDVAMGDSSEGFSPMFSSLKELSERYVNWEHLATGGMKSIYQVHDQASERLVALAKLHKGSAKEQYDSFIREARLTAKLEHPNIMTVHDVGVDNDNEPYFTMELKVGGTLEDILRKRREGNSEFQQKYNSVKLLDIFVKICDAIAYAHSKNVIHLDLKPANIQIGDFGEVIVCDWGLGKVLNDEDNAETDALLFNPDLLNDMTLSGHIKGTPGYMAPEQIEKNGVKDQQTDIYALGAILYSLLTDSSPIEGSTVEKIDLALKGDVISPKVRFPDKDIAASLNAVVLKSMSVRTQDRYASVTELRQDVQQFISGYATLAEAASLGKQLKLFWQRNRLILSVSLVFLVVTLTGMSSFVYQLKKSQEASEQALALYLKEKKELEATHEQWSQDITVNTEQLRYHFFFESPKRYVEQTIEDLNRALKVDPKNERALGLVGHQLFMTQRFHQANDVFAKSFYRQEDIYPLSQEFSKLKADDELLSVEQLTELIKQVGKNINRRHHLSERLLAWDAYKRNGQVNYSEAVIELLVIQNKGDRNFTFSYEKNSGELSIEWIGKKIFAEDNKIGSGKSLLRFLFVKSLKLTNLEKFNVNDLKGLNQLETLDLSQSTFQSGKSLSALPKLNRLILNDEPRNRQLAKILPTSVELILVD